MSIADLQIRCASWRKVDASTQSSVVPPSPTTVFSTAHGMFTGSSTFAFSSRHLYMIIVSKLKNHSVASCPRQQYLLLFVTSF
jgi:hypothetical protein